MDGCEERSRRSWIPAESRAVRAGARPVSDFGACYAGPTFRFEQTYSLGALSLDPPDLWMHLAVHVLASFSV